MRWRSRLARVFKSNRRVRSSFLGRADQGGRSAAKCGANRDGGGTGGLMRDSFLHIASTASLGLAIALAGAPASAKTTAECEREYAANKDTMDARGQRESDFINACLKGEAAVSDPVAAKSAPAVAESSNALREAAQNPIANLISVPFQNNTNFSVGPYHQTQNVLNIQPVIPFKLSDDWNLITRWITPVVYQPRLSPQDGPEFGLGNIQPAFFLSPTKPTNGIIWGVGPQFYLPTATDKTLGVNKWGAGPSFVALTLQEPWVVGALINNVWAGTGANRVNQMLIQPFVNYNLPEGWYLTSSPVITANWVAPESNRWTVPVGGGVGRLFKVDKLPVNAQVQAFYDAARPIGAPSWTLRFQVQFLFPAGAL